MAQAYVTNFMNLNETGFQDALSDEVKAVWARIEGDFELEKKEIEGKAAVAEFCHDNFFGITNQFDLVESGYSSFGPHAMLNCVVNQNKIDRDGVERRYHIISKTKLEFKEEGGDLKIIKIWERTSKDLIPN